MAEMKGLRAEPEQVPSRKCPQCNGHLYSDDGVIKCLMCGRTVESLAQKSVRVLSKKAMVERGIGLASTLASREEEALRLAAEGCKNREIAELMNWKNVKVADQYMSRIYKKLQLNGSVDKKVIAIKIYLTLK